MTQEAAGPPGERRQATVVFSDITGYTALTERLDPEEVSDVLAVIRRSAMQQVQRHAGTVNQFVGDEVMAVFGIPVSHEDDALRAVRAAAEMRGAIAEHGLTPTAQAARMTYAAAPDSLASPRLPGLYALRVARAETIKHGTVEHVKHTLDLGALTLCDGADGREEIKNRIARQAVVDEPALAPADHEPGAAGFVHHEVGQAAVALGAEGIESQWLGITGRGRHVGSPPSQGNI